MSSSKIILLPTRQQPISALNGNTRANHLAVGHGFGVRIEKKEGKELITLPLHKDSLTSQITS